MAKKKNRNKREDPPVVEDENLERFAGSSDEEHNDAVPAGNEKDYDDESDRSEDINSDLEENEASVNIVRKKGDQSVEEKEEIEEAEEDIDDVNAPTSGMANAMARILGTQVKKSSASAVLAKTVTPLQRMAREEKKRLDEAREKRQANRESKLTALHVPLSVATSRIAQSDESKSLVNELELERTHRRVATRGVVALFNAIAQHQKGTADTPKSSSDTKSPQKQEVANMSKHGFLDMIKKSAVENKTGQTLAPIEAESKKKTKAKWNALKDDYMLNSSKLKDWDKDSSDDEEDESQDVNDDWSDEEEESTKINDHSTKSRQSSSKRRKVVAQ